MSKRAAKIVCKLKNALFFLVLGILSVIGLLWFKRPSTSDVEKRTLTAFPEFTLTGLMDGSFAKGIDTWYADTYPLRELFIRGDHVVHTLYGDQSTRLIVRHETADAIPRPGQGTNNTALGEGQNGTAPGQGTNNTALGQGQNGTALGQGQGGSRQQMAAPRDPENAPDDIIIIETEPETDGNGTDEAGETDGNGTDGAGGADGNGETAASETEDGTEEEEGENAEEETVSGEMAGTVYVTGNSAYELYYFYQKAIDSYAGLINRTFETLGDRSEVYALTVPMGSGVLLDKSLLDELGASDEKEALDYLYSLISGNVHKINPYDILREHRKEYIYFRTDHHWTALGAYYAYQLFAREKGVEPHRLEEFERKEFPDFIGSYYSSSRADSLRNDPDTVIAYLPMGTNKMTAVTEQGEQHWSVVNDATNYQKGAKYICFVGGDQPLSYAHNPQITDGSSCVVIKDSFGNAFIPFLIDHYEDIYWIDFRYYKGTLTDLVREKEIDDIIYVLDLSNAGTYSVVTGMQSLVP